MKTIGAVVWERGAPWAIEEIEVDAPATGEVLVEWKAAGLCHSDEHARSGARVAGGGDADDAAYPLLGGHEGAGIVRGLGPDVQSLRVGDHVVATFINCCGRCKDCASGRGQLCTAVGATVGKGQLVDGSVRHQVRGRDLNLMAKLGTFAGHTVVAEHSLVRIDPKLPFSAASIVSCGVATGWGSAVVRAGTEPGDVVVVVGSGGLGISAIQGARTVGAVEVIAIDPIEGRRQQAERFGATHTAASILEGRPTVDAVSGGRWADRVVVTAGTVFGELIGEALDITARGGVCVVSGLGTLGASEIPMDVGNFALQSKELRGSVYGDMDPRTSAKQLLDLYRSGLLDLDGMITKYPLERINEAYEATIAGENIRGVVELELGGPHVQA